MARQTEAARNKAVQVHVKDRDRYDRLVAVVTLPDGGVLNHELVRAGLAWHYVRYAPNDQQLAALQREAQAARRGLWADTDPVPPWRWRGGSKTSTPLAEAAAAAKIRIVAVLPDPDGPDAGNERVRLANTTDQAIDLAGWRLQDGARHPYSLGGIVPAREQIEIRLVSSTFSLNNNRDEVVLLDPAGTIHDRLLYGKEQARRGRWIGRDRFEDRRGEPD